MLYVKDVKRGNIRNKKQILNFFTYCKSQTWEW